MNPDTADYLNDREETANSNRDTRIQSLADEVLADPAALDLAIGERTSTRLAELLVRLNKANAAYQNFVDDAYQKSVRKKTPIPVRQTIEVEFRVAVDLVDIHMQAMAATYATDIIDGKESEALKIPAFLRRQAD